MNSKTFCLKKLNIRSNNPCFINPSFIKNVIKRSQIFVTQSQLSSACKRLAREITISHHHHNPIVVCIMNGGLFVTSEVLKYLSFPLQVDYAHISRYQSKFNGSDIISWIKLPNINPEGRNVILFDDVLDGGLTLAQVKQYYKKCGAKGVFTVVMLDKQCTRTKCGLAKADYFGIKVEDEFLFGFGLDYHGYLRNMPSIHATSSSHINFNVC
jgi:hypoxanthine phosphoribosyltransferase